MAETTKSHERRLAEGWYEEHIKGPVIDIGSGPDPIARYIPDHEVTAWDWEQGDAVHMAGCDDESYSTVYASHVLEHVTDPVQALRSWYRILREGGKIVVNVPHRDLYEKRTTLPSQWNGDHKTFWLPDQAEPPVTLSLRDTIAEALPDAVIEKIEVLDAGYVSNGAGHSGGEYSIEAVIWKPDTQHKLSQPATDVLDAAAESLGGDSEE